MPLCYTPNYLCYVTYQYLIETLVETMMQATTITTEIPQQVYEESGTARKLAIETKGLTKTFDQTPVLRSVNLKVPVNSIFGFLGPNGAGKTTLMKCILGLIRPTSGSIEIFGQDINSTTYDFRHDLGYLSQQPSFYDYMTARQLLGFRARFFMWGQQDLADERIAEALELVGLEEKADRPIKGFSGGERQRLGIAQAQINKPKLLILDEPAAALDPMGRADVLRIMEGLRESSTIFYSTHILDDVQRVSDTVAILHKGNLMAQGPIETLLQGGNGVYRVELKGNTQNVHDLLSEQPWVSSVKTESINSHSRWYVTVTDEGIAEEELLRLILSDRSVVVKDFGFKVQELEDVFMSLVEVD